VLERIRIQNIAIIDEAEIEFQSGLNIISGETGAGKSIVIDAISLLLGGRANIDLVRAGCDEGIVEGVFDLSKLDKIQKRCLEKDFKIEDDFLLIKRILSKSGKNRIYVNGQLATRSILLELCEGLVDLCGQHEHQTLLKSSTQMDLIDRYAGLQEKVKNFLLEFESLKEDQKELKLIENTLSDENKRKDFLDFQIQEILNANLVPGEDEKLLSEKKVLQSTEQRMQFAKTAIEILEGSDEIEFSALSSLKNALSKVRNLAQLDTTAIDISTNLEKALLEIEESSYELNKYLEKCDLREERFLLVQERVSLISDLKKKYGQTLFDVLKTLEVLQKESELISTAQERFERLNKIISEKIIKLKIKSPEITAARKKGSKLFSKSIDAELCDLNMDEAHFEVKIDELDDPSEWSSELGANTIDFLIQTNKGEECKSLNKIASGGELSRIMLAIRRVISDRGGIGVYLFDEIDAGIGGKTAIQVGKKLKSVSEQNQVICITHLPQIASFADYHLCVVKKVKGNRTTTEIVTLSDVDRKKELNRMIGGSAMAKYL